MKVKFEGKTVDVAEKDCLSMKCFRLGQNKGTFTPGRGYTSYYKKPLWVCMERHLNGCPDFACEKHEAQR